MMKQHGQNLILFSWHLCPKRDNRSTRISSPTLFLHCRKCWWGRCKYKGIKVFFHFNLFKFFFLHGLVIFSQSQWECSSEMTTEASLWLQKNYSFHELKIASRFLSSLSALLIYHLNVSNCNNLPFGVVLMDLQLNSKILIGLYLGGTVLGTAKRATAERVQ